MKLKHYYYYYYYAANREENKSYVENMRSRALKFFANAAIVGNYLTGFAVSVKVEGALSLVLTEDEKYIETYIQSRKSIKLKFVRSVRFSGST